MPCLQAAILRTSSLFRVGVCGILFVGKNPSFSGIHLGVCVHKAHLCRVENIVTVLYGFCHGVQSSTAIVTTQTASGSAQRLNTCSKFFSEVTYHGVLAAQNKESESVLQPSITKHSEWCPGPAQPISISPGHRTLAKTWYGLRGPGEGFHWSHLNMQCKWVSQRGWLARDREGAKLRRPTVVPCSQRQLYNVQLSDLEV